MLRKGKKIRKKLRFRRGSNSRPSACKADVITATPRNPLGQIRWSRNNVKISLEKRECMVSTLVMVVEEIIEIITRWNIGNVTFNTEFNTSTMGVKLKLFNLG